MPPADQTIACPICGTVITMQESVCPTCGAKMPKRPCPYCGEEVLPGTEVCPFCHLEIVKRTKQDAARPHDDKVDGAIDDLLDELKKFQADTVAKNERLVCLKCSVPLNGTETLCPNCNADLSVGRAFACPRCHEPLTAEDEICSSCRHIIHQPALSGQTSQPPHMKTRQLRRPVISSSGPMIRPGQERTCSACGMPLGTATGSCPYCGTSIARAPRTTPQPAAPVQAEPRVETSTELRTRAEQVTSVSPHIVTRGPVKSQASHRGISNGVGETNGNSFVNGRKAGATNGTSFVNGKKKPAGSSFVNGTGVSNGLKQSGKKAGPTGIGHILGNWKFVSVLVAILVVIPTFIFLAGSHGGPPYKIDGDFGDWSHAVMHGARTLSSSASTSLEQWSVETDGDSVYLYAKMRANLMGGSAVESVFVYVDSDGTNTTGYAVGGLGADYLVQMDGWNGTVGSCSLLTFSKSDRYDWSGWQSAGQVEAVVAGSQIEARAQLPQAVGSDARFLLVTQDADESHSISYEVPAEGGLLIVRESVPGDIASSGVVSAIADAHLLDIEVSCEASSGTVEGLVPRVSGGTLTTQIQGFTLNAGGSSSFEVTADLSGATAGELVSARVLPGDVTTSFKAIQIVGDECLAYVGAAPARISIDGAFADWTGKIASRVSSSSGTGNVRINGTGAVNESESAFFYVSVEGQMCSGTYLPAIHSRASGSGQAAVVPHPRTAEDEMRIYIDSDRSVSTGTQVAADQRIIGADHLISIKGIYGRIVNITQYDWVAGEWNRTVKIQTIAAIDAHRMEISVNSSSIGTSSAVDFTIQTTSWRGIEDSVTSQSRPDPWVIRSGGSDYRSNDGVNWASGSTISLTGGDVVADMAPTPGSAKDVVYAVTNSGRVYSWQIGVSTSWSSNLTDPVNGTANIVAVAPYTQGQATGGYVLGSDGRLWNTQRLDGTMKAWIWVKRIASGITDFTDIEYQKTGAGFYAIREGSNTPVYWAGSGMNWATTAATGSSSTQTHVLHVGAPKQQNERIFVLCADGAIRTSADGGATWSALGNLPAPGDGNQSMYVGMDFDTSGYLWVATDTGWCYRSTDTTTYASFACTGRATDLGEIVALTAPTAIPEFGSFAIPTIALAALPILMHRRRRTK